MKGDLGEEIAKLKTATAKDMTLLGSGSILTQLAERGLTDDDRIMVDPVVLGGGTKIFGGLASKLDLKLETARTLKSRVVLIACEPMK